jgi:hypothetical protein
MSSGDRRRIVEIRLIVIVTVDLTNSSLTEVLAASGGGSSSLADVVSSEIVSNLESVSYVDAVIVSPL